MQVCPSHLLLLTAASSSSFPSPPSSPSSPLFSSSSFLPTHPPPQVRFVHEDPDTLLRYSSAEGGSFAFVLYYRLRRTEAGDAELKENHRRYAAVTLALGGTFYLPYRHHYTAADLRQAYPQVDEFFAKKREHDPHGMFRNMWYHAYGGGDGGGGNDAGDGSWGDVNVELRRVSSDPGESRVAPAPCFELRRADDRRCGSYRNLLKDPKLRSEFIHGFLANIFNTYVQSMALVPGARSCTCRRCLHHLIMRLLRFKSLKNNT